MNLSTFASSPKVVQVNTAKITDNPTFTESQTVDQQDNSSVVGARSFSIDEQIAFAQLSGDFNPIHMDSLVARRLLFGERIVHGLHVGLWVLNEYFADSAAPIVLTSFRAVFPRPAKLNESVAFLIDTATDGSARLLARSGSHVLAELDVRWRYGRSTNAHTTLAREERPRECRELEFDRCALASGELPLFIDESSLARVFPHLARLIPMQQIAAILATTRLIGMECPGYHSLFQNMDLELEVTPKESEVLSFKVYRADRRFSKIRLHVNSSGMSGTLTAFYRPPPVEQPGMNVIMQKVTCNEFEGQRALVIGGTRGIGEITAKLIVAGGGDVRITYHHGKADANRRVAELRRFRHSVACFPLDVTTGSIELGDHLSSNWIPTHLYYFASPFIAIGGDRAFSNDLFRKFSTYYVEGFVNAVTATRRLSSFPLSVFYPSTVFLDRPPVKTAEYCVAKAAGENVCKILQQRLESTTFYYPRLPRMRTDQTTSILPTRIDDPSDIMLERLRYVHSHRAVVGSIRE